MAAGAEAGLVQQAWVANSLRWVLWRLASAAQQWPALSRRLLSHAVVLDELKKRWAWSTLGQKMSLVVCSQLRPFGAVQVRVGAEPGAPAGAEAGPGAGREPRPPHGAVRSCHQTAENQQCRSEPVHIAQLGGPHAEGQHMHEIDSPQAEKHTSCSECR